ncbi:MAG TPA: CHAT domain-containing tetratricopeptide repeat protein, partial [Prolixibacteraceae bacterium]
MKVLKIVFLLFFSSLSLLSAAESASKDTARTVLVNYNKMVKSGQLMEAISALSGLLKPNIKLTEREKLAINNNLGILHKKLGQYDIALERYDAAESIYLINNFDDTSLLVSIYGNKVNIYSMRGDYKKALEYTEKAIRYVQVSNSTILFKQQAIASLYLNVGIIYDQQNDFNQALTSYKKSISIKNKYNLPGKENVYLNIAKAYSKKGDKLLADKYFNLSIIQSNVENKSSIFNIAQIHFEYGNFLLSINEYNNASKNIKTALDFNLKTFGEKNLFTSNSYQLLGDYYSKINDYQNALTYYQKALISGSKIFKDLDIRTNPSMIDITLNLWQLRILSQKAEVLSILADKEKDKNKKINNLEVSLNTITLATEMTNTIRVDYQDEETRLVFNEKQKNVFVNAIETALKLYDLTGEKRYLNLAYQTAQQCKANELKYEIARNKMFSNNEIPDSLQKAEKDLQRDISGYSALIRTESASPLADTAKIAYWKDQKFDLSRHLEKKLEEIERNYPRFIDKIKKGNIFEIDAIQASLKADESLIEYVISEKDEKGDRKLYEFVITQKDLVCHTELIDSTLSANFAVLKDQMSNQFNEKNSVDNYNQLNHRLYDAYRILIQPIEKHFTGKTLIIIPDDEISYLPFDAFLTSWTKRKRINYAELAYLIRDYSVSYGYSTNTLWNKLSKAKIRPKVIGFAPDYANIKSTGGEKYKELKSNKMEVESILNNFRGTILKGDQATIDNFKINLNSGAVLHLAMHAELDTIQAGTSSLIFSTNIKNTNNYHLYNYEIGQMNINSPMVVLSACNTGNGKLYSGEGLMSLSRNFVLAGVPSVIETLWPVEDVAGSKIMGSFYKYLSEGLPKNIALRRAKLDYINSTSPSFVNPRFWAAYSLTGDVSAIKRIWWKEPWIITTLTSLFLILAGIIIYR